MLHIILGASPNTRRYSYKATELLSNEGLNVYAVGIRTGKINGVEIKQTYPEESINTIGMYLSCENQEKYYNEILNNPPKRIVFNPGTYNPEFQKKLSDIGVNVINDCILLMVNRGDY